MMNLKTTLNALLILLLLITSCLEDSDDVLPERSMSDVPFQELYDQGLDKYLGTISPVSSENVRGSVTEHFFSSEDGSVCFTGNQFSMFTRDGSENNLLIFLQGGGFCSQIVCEALEIGIPLIPLGILDPLDRESPTFGFDLGYLPYCDGSLWMGDNEVDSDGDGVNDRSFKGLQNLSASLDMVADTYPSPDKIVLAGNSAGGYGVHTALPLVRKLYPNVKIMVINDSGMGLASPGFWDTTYEYWNSRSFIPSSCTDCLGDGNLTNYYNYQIAQDENMEMAFISSKQDAMASVGIGGEAYEDQLLEMTTELNNTYPERFNYLIAEGDEHTFIISNFNYRIGELTVKQWISDMITESEAWTSIVE